MTEKKMNMKALFQIGYGLYAVTSHDGKKDNGLIVNTVIQVTSTPDRIAVTINKQNYSHDIIKETGKMNVNCLTVETPFRVFEALGFVSGRNVDKFKDCEPLRSENGLIVLPRYIHGLGHGVGLEIHEAPRLSYRVTEPLSKGIVVTVEPGLYYPEWGGIRLEDIVYLDNSGKARCLTEIEDFLIV